MFLACYFYFIFKENWHNSFLWNDHIKYWLTQNCFIFFRCLFWIKCLPLMFDPVYVANKHMQDNTLFNEKWKLYTFVHFINYFQLLHWICNTVRGAFLSFFYHTFRMVNIGQNDEVAWPSTVIRSVFRIWPWICRGRVSFRLSVTLLVPSWFTAVSVSAVPERTGKMAAGSGAVSGHGGRGALEATLDRRFQGVSNTMESIQGLSTWCIENKKYHSLIVRYWMKWLKKCE